MYVNTNYICFEQQSHLIATPLFMTRVKLLSKGTLNIFNNAFLKTKLFPFKHITSCSISCLNLMTTYLSYKEDIDTWDFTCCIHKNLLYCHVWCHCKMSCWRLDEDVSRWQSRDPSSTSSTWTHQRKTFLTLTNKQNLCPDRGGREIFLHTVRVTDCLQSNSQLSFCYY